MAMFGQHDNWEEKLLLMFKDDDAAFIQKQRNAPKYDILHVYVIVGGLLHYRFNYAGWFPGPYKIDGRILADWSYIILAGPIVHAPSGIELKGFQGFRYCTELF